MILKVAAGTRVLGCADERTRELIELGLSCGRNAKAIWQDLVYRYSFTAVIKESSPSQARAASPEATGGN